MARPTKLTPEVTERIVTAIRAGNYVQVTAAAAGISASTLYRWLERGSNEQSGIYHDFRQAVTRAEAEAEVHAAAIGRKAMPDDWRAASWYLERRYPDRWRHRERLELEHARDEQTDDRLDLAQLPERDLRALKEIYDRASKRD